jgi:hypothetical protein
VTLIDILIGVLVDALVALVVFESAGEDVAVEKSEVALYLGIVVPGSFEDAALAEVVSSLALLLALLEVALVEVFVGVLEGACAVREVVEKAACVSAAVLVSDDALAELAVVLKLALIRVALDLILEAASPFLLAVSPFTVIVLFPTIKLA